MPVIFMEARLREIPGNPAVADCVRLRLKQWADKMWLTSTVSLRLGEG